MRDSKHHWAIPACSTVTLMLPTGDYRIIRQTGAGDDLALGEVRIR